VSISSDSPGTVTNFPPSFVVNSEPSHLSHNLLGECVGDCVPRLCGREEALDLGVGVVRILKVSCPSSSVVSSSEWYRGLEPNTSSLLGGGLKEGGDEGAEDSVTMSEKSAVKSEIEEIEDAYESLSLVEGKLEVLKLLAKLGEPCLEVDTGILDSNFCGVGVLDVEIGRRSGDGDTEVELDASDDEDAECFKNLFFISSTASSVDVGLSEVCGVVFPSGLVIRLNNLWEGLSANSSPCCLSDVA
jgi:hypothetical protein